jgi:hypothetical protein
MNFTIKTGSRLRITERGESTGITIQSQPSMQIAVGVQGPAGAAGATGGKYDHTQAVAATEWTVTHNLGFYPNVDVFSVGGVKRVAKVAHTSVNVAVISFNLERAGSAHFS